MSRSAVYLSYRDAAAAIRQGYDAQARQKVAQG